MEDTKSRWLTASALVLAVFWCGLVLGVSFLSTVARFAAPSVTVPIAIDIGQVTFHWLARAEWALAVLTLLVAWRQGPLVLAAGVLLALIVLLQSAWLLPALDVRAAMVMAGERPPPSIHHGAYSTLEIAKVVILLATAGVTLQRLVKR